MGKPKCPECNGCMDFVWFGPKRYLHCWFCQTYYEGRLGELKKSEDPFTEKKENVDGDAPPA